MRLPCMLIQEEGVMEEVEGEVEEDPEVEEETIEEIEEVRIVISRKSPASTAEERDI